MSERTRACVSERADAPTPASAAPRRRSVAERAGFEPAVLSHTAFRERHHQPLGHLSAREDTKPGDRDPQAMVPGQARRPGQPTGRPANSASASSRRMPLTTLMRRGSDVVLGELDDRAGGAVDVVREREDERLDVALEERPDAHRAGLEGREDRGVGEPRRCRASGRASRRATMTAWAVGSFVSWTRSWARATIASSTTATAAIGRSPRASGELRFGEGLAHEQFVVHGRDASRRRRAGRHRSGADDPDATDRDRTSRSA